MQQIFSKNWNTIEIGKIVKVLGGFAFKSSDFSTDGCPVIRISNLNGGLVDISDCVRIPKEKIGRADRFKLEPGDILIAMSGATTGKLGFVPDNLSEDWFLNQRVGAFRIKPSSPIDRSYFRAFLKTQIYQSHVWNLAAGAAQPNISSHQLESALIPLPPLEEQKRIAKILDLADNLKTQRRQALAELDALLQSVFLDMFGDPVTNPKGWEIEKLGSHTTKVGSGATPKGGNESYKREGLALIRSLNVRDGEFQWKDLARIDDTQAKKLSNVVVEHEDVLLNITGASVARVCRAPQEVLPARVNQHVCIIRTQEGIEHKFLEKLLLTTSMKHKLLAIGESGATRQAITKAEVLNLEVPLPPLELQRRFATIVEQVEQQKARMREHLNELDTLFASLQHRAFNGEL